MFSSYIDSFTKCENPMIATQSSNSCIPLFKIPKKDIRHVKSAGQTVTSSPEIFGWTRAMCDWGVLSAYILQNDLSIYYFKYCAKC